MNLLDLAPRLAVDVGPWKAKFGEVLVRVIPSAMPRHFYIEYFDPRPGRVLTYTDQLFELKTVPGAIAGELLRRGILVHGLECTWEKDEFRSYDRRPGDAA